MFSDLYTTIELNERYFNKKDLTKAVVKRLTEEGKLCQFINKDLILINGEEYIVKEKNYGYPIQVQRALLSKVK